MERNRYQTSHVADQLGVSVSTIRRLCSRYAAHLSEDATPAAGGRRQFTADDVEVLRLASRLTLAGLSESEIARRLAQSVTLPAAQPSTEPPTATTAPPQPPTLRIDATALAEQVAPLVAAVNASNESTDRLAAALEHFSTALVWFAAALLVIVLITVAVAAGWL